MQPSQGYIYEQCLPQGPQEMDPGIPIPLHGSPILFHTNGGEEYWGRPREPCLQRILTPTFSPVPTAEASQLHPHLILYHEHKIHPLHDPISEVS